MKDTEGTIMKYEVNRRYFPVDARCVIFNEK